MPIVPGTLVDRYEILALLGKGGMGEVYLAFDTRLKRKVALKLLPEQFTQDPDRVRRFEQEAETASALNHPSIITIHEIGKVDGTYFLVTELIEGQTLRERMRVSRLLTGEAIDIASQMCGALAEAHAARIVHRDIKPENVMVRPDGLVKVLDFGLAKLTERDAPQLDGATLNQHTTDPGIAKGTVQYMSPEQARGEVLDARTDIFSLGVTLYEMVAGVNPFGGANSEAETFVKILGQEPAPLSQHAPVTPAELDRIARKALRKNRDERYQTARELLADLGNLKRALEHPAEYPSTAQTTRVPVAKPARQWGAIGVAVAAVVAILATAGVFLLRKPAQVLTSRDTIVLADFVNSTGDAVFDGALRQGLAVQLEQSPFLDIFPDARVRQTLRLMGRPPDERVTRDVAREICLRQGLKAFIAGSIATLGSHYVVGLEAVNSQTGDVIARQQVESVSKEQVLKALGDASNQLRVQLGESLSSIEKFDAPLEVTTSSLEALKAYSLAFELGQKGRFLEAVPFYQKAIELDPNFAYAYDNLAVVYSNSGQTTLAAQFAEKGFALRDRVSELEKFRITFYYYTYVTGELDKARETLELHRIAYPRDYRAAGNIASNANDLGQSEQAVDAGNEALRLNSPSSATRGNLTAGLLRLNRFDEARQVAARAMEQGLDSTELRDFLYQIAFVKGDAAEMQRLLDDQAAKPDAYQLLDVQAEAEAFDGHWRTSQEVTRRAVRVAVASGVMDVDRLFRARAALRAATLDRCTDAKSEAAQISSVDADRDTLDQLASTFAWCGDTARAEAVIAELGRRFPKYTLINGIAIPHARAALALRAGNAPAAIEALEPARRYERASRFRIQYLRGLAYLQAKAPTEAAAEFQRILANRGEGAVWVRYPLAHLGLARAEAMRGDVPKARQAYQDFFNVWKDADADLPPLVAAKQEFQKLPANPSS